MAVVHREFSGAAVVESRAGSRPCIFSVAGTGQMRTQPLLHRVLGDFTRADRNGLCVPFLIYLQLMLGLPVVGFTDVRAPNMVTE